MENKFMRCWIVVMVLAGLWACVDASAQEIRIEEMKAEMRRTGSSWRSSGDSWQRSSGFAPDEDLGQFPDNKELLKTIRVEWNEPKLDSLGSHLLVKGRLYLHSNGDQRTTLSWRQGVTILIAMRNDLKPDWAKGMSGEDTIHACVLTDKKGEFEVTFEIHKDEVLADPKGDDLQVGVVLAERTVADDGYSRITWTSTQSAITESIQSIKIPAVPHVSTELRLIRDARHWPFEDPDSGKLIRAVNALQPLGKKKALEVLEEYLELARDTKEYDNHDIVFWIIRALFEPVELDNQIPKPMLFLHLDDRDLPADLKWPLNPIAIVDDVPFMIGCRIGGGGQEERPDSHIRFVRNHCVIRDEQLQPRSSPVAIAKSILASERLNALGEYSKESAIRMIQEHAVAMASELVRAGNPTQDPSNVSTEDLWKSTVRSAEGKQVRWNLELQKFELGDEFPK